MAAASRSHGRPRFRHLRRCCRHGFFWSAELLPDAIIRPPTTGSCSPGPSTEAIVPGARPSYDPRRRAAGAVSPGRSPSAGIVARCSCRPVTVRSRRAHRLGGGGGAIDEYWGAMLASRGYAALNLAYFNMPGLPRGLSTSRSIFRQRDPLDAGQPWLGDRLLAVWGPSRGGELALLLGATFPDSTRSAPGCRAASCSGARPRRIGRSEVAGGLTFNGRPLPYLQEATRRRADPPVLERGNPSPMRRSIALPSADRQAEERATIPVDKYPRARASCVGRRTTRCGHHRSWQTSPSTPEAHASLFPTGI